MLGRQFVVKKSFEVFGNEYEKEIIKENELYEVYETDYFHIGLFKVEDEEFTITIREEEFGDYFREIDDDKEIKIKKNLKDI